MKRFARIVAGCLASLALAAPAWAQSPAPAGVGVIDVSSSNAPVTGMQLFVPAGLDRQPRDRSGLAAVVAQALVRTPVHGVPLADAIAQAGGSVTYAVDGQETHFYLEATPSHFAEVASLFASALAQPAFDRASISSAAAHAADRAAQNNGDGLTVGVAMFRSVYLARTNARLSTWGNAATLAQITPLDAADFFRANYVARGAIIVGVGNPSPGLREGEQAITRELPDRRPSPVVVSRQLPVKARSRELITHRDVPAPWVVLGYDAPSPGAPDFAAALVLESLIGQAVGRGLAPPLVATPSEGERPVGSIYLFDTVPSAVVIYANGAGGDPTLAVRTVATVVQTLTASPLSEADLSLAKAQATGDFLMQQAALSDRSWLAGNFAREGVGDDYSSKVLTAIAAVSPVRLRAAAKRYFSHYVTSIVLPREGRS